MLLQMDSEDKFILKLTIAREARNRTPAERFAIMNVIFNRVLAEPFFHRGKTVKEVCCWPFQFTSINARTNPPDPNLTWWPFVLKVGPDLTAWLEVSAMVEGYIGGPDPTNGALLYHSYSNLDLAKPEIARQCPWAIEKNWRASIGVFRFYRE